MRRQLNNGAAHCQSNDGHTVIAAMSTNAAIFGPSQSALNPFENRSSDQLLRRREYVAGHRAISSDRLNNRIEDVLEFPIRSTHFQGYIVRGESSFSCLPGIVSESECPSSPLIFVLSFGLQSAYYLVGALEKVLPPTLLPPLKLCPRSLRQR